MASAGTYTIPVVRNADLSLYITLKDEDGNVIDLTSYTVAADIVGDTNVVPQGRFELNPTINDAAGGVILISITDTESGTFSTTENTTTAGLPKWDLLITDGTGFTTKAVTGRVTVEETQTT